MRSILTMSDITTYLGTTTSGQLLVRSGIEIERVLESMIRDGAPVQARLKDLMFLSRLVHFDPAEQQVLVAYTDHKPANSAVLALRSVTFLCNHRNAQFAFVGTKPSQGMHLGRPAIKMSAPPIMLAMQHHRNQAHGQLPGEADVRCELWLGVISFEARLVDMSLDGKAFLLGDPGIPLCAGTRLEKARILHEDSLPLQVDIQVDQVNHVLHNGKRATRIGCRIVTDRQQMERIIRLFIIDLQ
jgi:c-di-GMP-binding flagellar brake protein YcgR